jgi:hypothetical protein
MKATELAMCFSPHTRDIATGAFQGNRFLGTWSMPHWLIKCALQKAFAVLPASHQWNALCQEYLTRTQALGTDQWETKLAHCRTHLERFFEARPEFTRGFTALEVGTGWFPIVPVGLFLCGAREVWTFDIDPLLSPPRIRRMLDRFAEYDRSGALAKCLPRLVPERVARLRDISEQAGRLSPAEFLKLLNIHFQVRDARDTGLPAGSVDLVVTTGVLEYIPPDILRTILEKFVSLTSPRGLQSHYLNLIDQYSHFDKSLSPYHFLKFSSGAWRFYNSPLTWQNRFRISDFRKLFAATGYRILREDSTPGSPADLARVPLAPEFQGYAPEDLLVLYSWLLVEPARS